MDARHRTLKMQYLQVWYVKKSIWSIHSISIMMQIFYIDWQQHWKYDRTMNIGANTHGKRAVSTKQVTDLRPPFTVGLPVTSERYWASFTSPETFTMRLFHSATIFCCYICTCICCFKLHQADYQVGEFFLTQFGGGHSAPMYLLFVPYTDL